MKNRTTKTAVLLIIQLLILSQIAFAETFDEFDDGPSNEVDSQKNDYKPNEKLDSEQYDDSDGKYKNDGSYKNEGMPPYETKNYQGQNYKDYPKNSKEQYTGEFNKGQFGNNMNNEYEFKSSTYNPQSGPSYEGFNKEQMLFGRLFPYIEGGINPSEIKQYCDNPSEMADMAISKIKTKIGSISNVCNDLGKEESQCREMAAQRCSKMRQPDTSYAVDELHRLEILSQSCPVNADAIKQSCILRIKENFEERSEFAGEMCEIKWENYGKQNQQKCEKIQSTMICDESGYIENCLAKYGANENQKNECPEPSSMQKTSCENGYSLKDKKDYNGCFIGYECVYNQPEAKQCAMTNDEVNKLANECASKKGSPERTYNNGCITGVICREYQCPYTNEQVSEKESACAASKGRFEKKVEGSCIVQMECYPQTAAGDSITGKATGYNTKQQCYNEWQNQKQNCEKMNKECRGKDEFVKECSTKENEGNNIAHIEKQCDMESKIQVRHMERQCAGMEFEKKGCLDESSKRCSMMEGIASECREKVTEDNFRKFIISEFEKKCKFMPYMKQEQDFSKYDKMEIVLAVLDTVTEEDVSKVSAIVENLEKKYEQDGKIIYGGAIRPSDFSKLKELSFIVGAKLNAPESSEISKERKESILSKLDPSKVVEKLLELTGSDVSGEYKYIIEDQANDILEASESINDVQKSEESRGFGYKIKLFLGFAKDAEESEIKNLKASKERLETSIKSLSKLAEELQDDITKAILKEQVAELERQKEDIGSLIKQKEKKAKGLLRLFGLFG